jgi:hypothetical protein
MKHLRTILTLSVAALLLAAGNVCAQAAAVETLPVKMVISLDALGDAEITFEMEMSAKQWQAWKQQYGENPSLLRRDMGQFVSAYAVDDFDLDQDDMDRRMTMTIKASGVARHLGDGRYELELEPEMKTGEIIDGGREVRFDYTQSNGPGSVMLMDQIVKLPDGATGVEQSTDSTGTPVIEYQVPIDFGGGGGSIVLLVLGILLTVGGLAVLPIAFLGGSKVAKPADAA